MNSFAAVILIHAPDTESAEQVVGERTGYEEELGFDYSIIPGPLQRSRVHRYAAEEGLQSFAVSVRVECETLEQAEQVFGERFGPDEDLGFPYWIEPGPARSTTPEPLDPKPTGNAYFTKAGLTRESAEALRERMGLWQYHVVEGAEGVALARKMGLSVGEFTSEMALFTEEGWMMGKTPQQAQ